LDYIEDIEEVKPILSDSEGNDLEGNDLSEAILEYGISEGKFCVLIMVEKRRAR